MSKHNKPPAFQFYVKDWLSSPTTRTMSLEAKGAYIQLLATAWDGEPPGSLPKDDERLRMLAGASDAEWMRVRVPVLSNFSDVRGKLVNKKLREQWSRLSQFSENKRDAANIMWAKKRGKSDAGALHVQCSSSSSSSASSITPKTLKEREEKTKYVPSALLVSVDLWLAFAEMRQKIRKPLTNHAADLIANKLRAMSNEGQDPCEVLSQSIMNGWAGVFAVKENHNGERLSFEQQKRRREEKLLRELYEGADFALQQMEGGVPDTRS